MGFIGKNRVILRTKGSISRAARRSGRRINPMMMVQKLTQAAALLKQGENCSKILLMKGKRSFPRTWKDPPSCRLIV